MDNLPVKVDGTTSLSATEFNNIPNEIENLVTTSGQTLGVDQFQVSRAAGIYGSGGQFFNESGVANAYVLLPPGSKIAPSAYFAGLRVLFIAGNTNTSTTVTINVNSIGIKNVKLRNGTSNPAIGDIEANRLYDMVYDGTNFRMVDRAKSEFGFGPTTELHFDGNGGVSIDFQKNVSLVSRTAPGDYTVNFSSNYTNTFYRVYGSMVGAFTPGGQIIFLCTAKTISSVSFQILAVNNSGEISAPVDAANIWISIVGDLA